VTPDGIGPGTTSSLSDDLDDVVPSPRAAPGSSMSAVAGIIGV
jgi:hypothetical protein